MNNFPVYTPHIFSSKPLVFVTSHALIGKSVSSADLKVPCREGPSQAHPSLPVPSTLCGPPRVPWWCVGGPPLQMIGSLPLIHSLPTVSWTTGGPHLRCQWDDLPGTCSLPSLRTGSRLQVWGEMQHEHSGSIFRDRKQRGDQVPREAVHPDRLV